MKLSVNLFRNNKALSEAPLEVAGSTDAVPDLVKKMVQAVSPLLKKE